MEREALTPDQATELESAIEALRAEHQALDARLIELDNQVYLTPEEQVERKNCQKLKLLKKDKMYDLKRRLG